MDARKLQILGAIVEDYVATREPVGSKALLERHELGVSPATVRNDMSVLEDEGLITQPYTSAGRIPTDKGYRVFVDHIAQVKPLSVPERRAINSLFEGAGDLDDVLSRTVRLLAQLTHHVAVVQYPSLNQAKVRHVELVKVGERHALVVLITDSGRVDQRTVELAQPRDEKFLHELRTRINAAAVGHSVTTLEKTLQEVVSAYPEHDREAAAETVRAVQELLDARREERLIMAGTANLARYGIDPHTDIAPLLDAVEEQIVLLRLLSQMRATPGEVEVRIGQEMQDVSLTSAALVSAGYGRADAPGSAAHLAILGPSRMDYVTGISSVRAVARYISRFVG
ncbi:heat-inducible transcriptional repressor HrcA [Dermabacteraceae bacterium P13115]|nr:heat-inducible transcriptional repressor HrcA [Dermabacteraceae bacterium TAE3-ERU27]MBV7432321.1 heat-inducible transcriptional repressor HrcA [Dermabacteraceae bacterium TAE3-ERU5]